jgi:hypothetical protein
MSEKDDTPDPKAERPIEPKGKPEADPKKLKGHFEPEPEPGQV